MYSEHGTLVLLFLLITGRRQRSGDARAEARPVEMSLVHVMPPSDEANELGVAHFKPLGVSGAPVPVQLRAVGEPQPRVRDV
jgi:hypothetical protein